jgi:hypothetical protein
MNTIDLNKARTNKDAKVFAGRERGKHWRNEFRLDDLDSVGDPVEVVIPEDVIAVNISFFLSMFGKSVRSLGKEQFRQHYKFQCSPDLIPLINLGIEQAVKTSSALAD